MKNNSVLKMDVTIIGAGPSGLTCAVYSSRGNLKTCFIDKGAPGGKMVKTFQIENWTGDENIKGYELSLRMLNHAKKEGAQHIFGNVIKIENVSEFEHYVYLEDGTKIETKAIVLATGMNEKKPDIPHINEYENKGVSYCVICDASLYRNKPGAIIGGGDSAFEEAMYLASIASEVFIFVRGDKPKAHIKFVQDVEKTKNINVLYNAQIVELIGKDNLQKVKYIQDGQEKEMTIEHLYPYIGALPSNEFFKDLPILDESGFVITNENMATSVPGVYAIGDIRKKHIKQIITAANDGAICGKVLTNIIKNN